jgi:hypothetical protein
MKRIHVLGLAVCAVLLANVASAGVVPVTHILDYTDNPANLYYFWPPTEEYFDHPPYHRGSLEDWGWTHDVTGLVPVGARGIRAATVSITAWDVDSDFGEDDVIYANYDPATKMGTKLGLLVGEMCKWTTTSFALPTNILNELWQTGQVSIYIDIDQHLEIESGYRVTLQSSELEVEYIVGDDLPMPAVAVHRFWSDVLQGHFYTATESERVKLLNDYTDVWTYEGVVFHVFTDPTEPNVLPVYRFWSDKSQSHFYTMSEGEKDKLRANHAAVWTYEGPVFYAYAEGLEPAGAAPVYRFWSERLGRHFYTISESEMYKLVNEFSSVWTIEEVAWYAYE